MAGNEELIDDIVAPVANKQVQGLTDDIINLDSAIIDTIKSISDLNKLTGNSSSFTALNKNIAAQSLAQEKLNLLQQQSILLQAKKDAIVQASADKQSAAQAKIQAAEQKASDKAISDSLKRQQQADKEATNFEKNEAKKQAALAKTNNAYQQLKQKTSDAVKNAQTIGAEQGTGSQSFKDAQENAEKYQKQLNGINNALGDNSDKVGGYTQGIAAYFGKAYSGIRQLAFALPGIGVSGIFLLLYEGLKQFVDELSQGRFAIDAYAASAKALNSAFADSGYKQAVENVFDLNEQIKLSKQGFIDSEIVVDKYNQSIGEVTGKVSTLDEVEKKLTENSQNYIKSMFFKAAAAAALSQGTDDLIKATHNLLTAEANSILTSKDLAQIRAGIAKGGDSAEAYKGLLKIAENADRVDKQSVVDKKKTQDALVNQTAAVYDKLATMAQAFATKFGGGAAGQDIDQRRLNSSAETQKILLQKQIDANNDILDNDKKSYAQRNKALQESIAEQKQLRGLQLNQDLSDITLQSDQKEVIIQKYNADIDKLNIDAVKKSRDLKTQQNKDEIALDNQRLENAKKTAEGKTQDPSEDYDTRLQALDDYQKAAKGLVNNAEKIAISDAGNNQAKVKTAKEKAANDLLDVDNETAKKRLQINKEVNAELVKEFAEGIKGQTKAEQDSITDFKDAQDAKLLAIEQNKSDTLKSLADQYSQGKISAADYNQQVSDIEYESSQDRVQTQIDSYQKIIDTQKEYLAFGIGTDKDLQKSQDDLTKFKIQQSDLATKKELDNIKQLESARKDLANLEKEVAGASIDLIQKVVDGGYQNQLNALKEQSDQVNENAQNEKDAINNSLLSTYDKAQKTQIIDKQTAAAQKAITDQENDVKTKQAKFDRIVSLAKIAEATAIAEVQALSYLSNPFTAPLYPAIAALIGALGAIQLASVLATPLPKYEMGGTTYGGALIWGEKGMEKATLPDGSVQYSPNTATVTTFPSGTVITPHMELMQQIRPDKINYAGGQEVPWKEVLSELRKNRPVKQKTINRININGSFDTYRKNYFR